MIPKKVVKNVTRVREPTRTFAIKGNRINGFIDGKEAMKQAIDKILQTERYRYLIYSWKYGVELIDLFGKHTTWVKPEIERRVTEALMTDERILDVYDFHHKERKDEITTTFTVSTIFGELEQEVRVNV